MGQAPGPGQQENCETMNLTDDQLDWGVHTRLELERRSRDVVRKRRSFKMTQNTFDKIWRRLPVALEY